KDYSRQQFVADVIAGVIVGIVALPLAIAFAIASGVSPERGLYTAIIAGFLISALGGSRVQIGGPTGAFVVIVYGIVQTHGVDGLIVATIMAGAPLAAAGAPARGGAGRVRRHRLRDRPDPRGGRAHRSDDNGGRAPRRVGSRAARGRDQVHSLPRDGRLHQRDRGHHLLRADRRSARPAARGGARGLHRQVESVRRTPPHG